MGDFIGKFLFYLTMFIGFVVGVPIFLLVLFTFLGMADLL